MFSRRLFSAVKLSQFDHVCLARRLFSSVKLSQFDHVCLAVTDMEASTNWFASTLGLRLAHENEDHFYPKCSESPAFLTGGGGVAGGSVAVALLAIPKEKRVDDHQGAHVAFRVDIEEWDRCKSELGKALEKNKVHSNQRVDVEYCDYGIQQSLFFHDPDHNVLELTCWKERK
ncbi:hypothetical protein TrST_g14371 [Triparma strigata]|uniref:VOC domain-containing protein n=1 Tax=Triparma strigata TaxID=1606541 RepID=A0A9W7AYT2_9STRA|nr:hypothetical protein TrST_g14371 [Triparma strigata]